MKKINFRLLVVITLSLFMLSACGGGSSSSDTPSQNGPSDTQPLAPDNFQVTIADGTATLTWAASNGANSYNLYYAEQSFGSPPDVSNYQSLQGANLIQDVAGTSQTVDSLTNGTTYFFVVTAENAAGESGPSSEISAAPQTLPEAPSSLAITEGVMQVTLSWQSAPGAENYNLYYARESFGAPPSVDDYDLLLDGEKIENVSETMRIVDSLTSGANYYFVVTAENPAGESSASNEVSGIPEAPEAKPSSGKLNDTGIAWAAEFPSVNNSDCNSTSISANQDCDSGRDGLAASGALTKIGSGKTGFDFTRLNEDGTEYASSGDFSSEPWACVRDNVTNIVWEVKTDDDGLRDKENTYSWYNTDTMINFGNAGAENAGTCPDSGNCDTRKYAASVNAAGLCGANDWRMPNREELRSIVDFSDFEPALDVNYFPFAETEDEPYWSSASYAGDASFGWIVSFDNGEDDTRAKSTGIRVRLMRVAE